MSREWKPGQVAMLSGLDGDEIMAFRQDRQWATQSHLYLNDWQVKARPLVVIDPEDREAVERLLLAYGVVNSPGNLSRCIPNMQAALREFANPTPPRIDEPGTWGVVEAACVHSDRRREWVRFPSGNWHSVRDLDNHRQDIENPDDWDSLIEPTLVREGVR